MRAAYRMRRRDSGSSKSSRRFGFSKKDMGWNLCRPGHSRSVANRFAVWSAFSRSPR